MNSVAVLSEVKLRHKKLGILFCGVVIFFLTSMAKVLIPATIFQDLLNLPMPVNRISALGAAFMYSYAGSQLLMGCFSDRYGGVRILLIGGGLFTLGTIAFPLAGNFYLMIFFRILTGFGAGTIFLGVAKLLADLYPGSFGTALGLVLLWGYLGPTVGTVPMVKLVEAVQWKLAMILPGAAAFIPLLLIVLLCRGVIKPVTRGQTLEPLLVMIKNRYMWYVCLASASIYGAYYALVSQIGQKIFSDVFARSSGQAAAYIMILTIVVAVNNMGGNLFLKLLGSRRKAVILLGTMLSLAGVAGGFLALRCGWSCAFFAIAVTAVAIPAGFFPMLSLVAKELNLPQYTAMAVAFLNFMAFVFISLYQNITGSVLKNFVPDPVSQAFPVQAYSAVFGFFLIGAVISLLASCLVPETRDRH